jgi:wyosine [tRNA(Phe)-imidazoG37] synthetase (radical SAM superfamily)
MYVYPVLSRRAGGLSIGLNLNPNDACNWHCAYCQVPNLTRGAAPAIDLARLEAELRGFLADVLAGGFFDRCGLPEAQRRIRDLAISGNGEPTTCQELEAVIAIIDRVGREAGLSPDTRRVLISNGSLAAQPAVRRALRLWAGVGGEVWFKLDSATAAGIRRINGVNLAPATVLRNLEAAAAACPTWIQTCLFQWDGQPPAPAEQEAYLAFLASLAERGIRVEGVLLYGLARPSLQPEAARLSALPAAWLEDFGARIGALGLPVKVSF